MGKLGRFMKIFDIYGNVFQLRINNQKKFQTAIGGFFSLITIGILVICILSFGADFFSKTNPKVVIEEGIFLNETPILNGTDYVNRSFILAVDKVYNTYNKFTLIDNEGRTTFPEQCLPDKLADLGVRSTRDFAIYCLNLNEYNLGLLSMSFRPCSGFPRSLLSFFSRSNITCNTNDTNITMKSVNMYTMTPELGFKPNQEYPFIERMSYNPLIFNSMFTNNMILPINIQYLEDDSGWMIKDVQEKFDIDMSNPKFQYVSVEKEVKFPQVNIIISVGSKFKRYSRSYVKFQEFLAVIGGFMKLVLSVLNISLMLAKTYLIDLHIISTQFNDKIKKEMPADNTSNQSNQSKQALNIELINNFIELQVGKTREQDQPATILKESKKIKKDITLSKYTKAAIMNMFNCKSHKQNDNEINIIRKKLNVADKLQDYDMILKKVNEIEVIKKMLFTDTQLLCFDFMEKPNFISREEDNTLSRSMSMMLTKEEKKKDELVNNYVKIISEETLKGLDEKFFKILDDDIKAEVFKKLVK